MSITIKLRKNMMSVNVIRLCSHLYLVIVMSLSLFTSKHLEAGVNDDIKSLLSNKCVEIMMDDSFYNRRELKDNDSVIFGRAKVIKNKGKYGIVSNDGITIVEVKYDSIILDDDVGLRYIVQEKGKYGLIDFHGNILIKPEYDFLTSNNSDSLYLVGKNDKYGIIDANGKVFVPIIYDDIEVFKHEIYKVQIEDKVGIVDATGTVIVPIEYEYVDVHYGFNFIVEKDGKFGLVVEGNLVLGTEFDDIKCLGRDYYSFKKDGRVGLIYRGNIILDREFDFIYRVNKNIFLIYKNSKFGLVKYVDNELIFVLNIEYDLIELKDRSWKDIEYSVSSEDYHFMETYTDDGSVFFDRLFYERDIIVFKKDDRFGLIKINYYQKEDDFVLAAIYDRIEIVDRYVIGTSIYSEPIELDVPMFKYFIVEKGEVSSLLDEDGVVITQVKNGDVIFHWGSLSQKIKKTCSLYMNEKDVEKLEKNKKVAFIIVSKDKVITPFIDESEKE